MEAPERCEAEARAFFGAFLGLPELLEPEALRSRGDGWLVLPDGQQLHLSVTPNFVPREKGRPALRCPDLTAFRARCDAYGVPDRPDAGADVPRVFLRDPFGNRLEVVEGKHESVPADGTS